MRWWYYTCRKGFRGGAWGSQSKDDFSVTCHIGPFIGAACDAVRVDPPTHILLVGLYFDALNECSRELFAPGWSMCALRVFHAVDS